MKIQITIIIDDPEIIKEYKDINPDLIVSDFESSPDEWLPGSSIEAEFIN